MATKSKQPRPPEARLFADQKTKLPMTIRITPQPGGDYMLHATANLSEITNPITLQNFYRDLNLRLGDRVFRFTANHAARIYTCEQRVSAEEMQAPFELIYKNQVLDAASFDPNSQTILSQGHPLRRLLVFEIRGLSRQRTDHYPGDRTKIEGFNPRQHAPITDLHTHLTAQISADDLIAVACEHEALYPIELLRDKLGIPDSELPKDRYDMPAAEFVPTAADGLACEKGGGKPVEAVRIHDLSKEQQQILARALTTPIDRVHTFDGIERHMYRFRNPLTKNDQLIAPIILKVAERYREEGVRYTEQAVTGVGNPKWLEKALPALEEAKATFGVDMRFLIGIPRTFQPERMLNEIRKVAHVSWSPHIVGVDFLGYEANKTQNFHWALTQLGQWISEQKANPETREFFEDFTLRVHAGETGKNLDNVYEAMQVANRFNVRLRIGHGIYIDMDEDFKNLAREMAKKGLITVEFNPDSNIALNNIDFQTDIPFRLWRELGVPCVLSTDGAGAYGTDMSQTAQNMLYAGMTLADLETIRSHEEGYIAEQQKRFAKKSVHFTQLFPDGNAEFIAHYKRTCDDLAKNSIRGKLPEELNGRTPILVAGASGSSWKMVDESDRIEVETAMAMLVQLVDPEKAYFAVGRIKDEGITRLLDKAISALHDKQAAGASHFKVIGLLSEIQNMPRLPENLSHIWPLTGGLMSVPSEMINFLHQHKGHALFIGGGAFTRDFVHYSESQQVPFGVMSGPKGTSTDKARVYGKEHVFVGAVGMLQHLIQQQPCIFRSGVDLSLDGLHALHDRLRDAIEETHMPPEVIALQESFTARVKAAAPPPVSRTK